MLSEIAAEFFACIFRSNEFPSKFVFVSLTVQSIDSELE